MSSSPTPCHAQGHLQPDQVALSPVQPGLECFQGWGIDHLSGQPMPGPHHPHHNKFLPFTQSKCPLFQFETIPPCPNATGPAKKPVPTLPVRPLEALKCRKEISPQLSLPQADQPQLSQPVPPAEGFQPSDRGRGLLWPHSSSSRSLATHKKLVAYVCSFSLSGPWR